MICAVLAGITPSLRDRLLEAFPGRVMVKDEPEPCTPDLVVIGPEHSRPLAAAQASSRAQAVILLVFEEPVDEDEVRAKAPLVARDLFVAHPEDMDSAVAAYRRALKTRRHRATLRRLADLI